MAAATSEAARQKWDCPTTLKIDSSLRVDHSCSEHLQLRFKAPPPLVVLGCCGPQPEMVSRLHPGSLQPGHLYAGGLAPGVLLHAGAVPLQLRAPLFPIRPHGRAKQLILKHYFLFLLPGLLHFAAGLLPDFAAREQILPLGPAPQLSLCGLGLVALQLSALKLVVNNHVLMGIAINAAVTIDTDDSLQFYLRLTTSRQYFRTIFMPYAGYAIVIQPFPRGTTSTLQFLLSRGAQHHGEYQRLQYSAVQNLLLVLNQTEIQQPQQQSQQLAQEMDEPAQFNPYVIIPDIITLLFVIVFIVLSRCFLTPLDTRDSTTSFIKADAYASVERGLD